MVRCPKEPKRCSGIVLLLAVCNQELTSQSCDKMCGGGTSGQAERGEKDETKGRD